jgi:hypothetical protein
MLTVLRTGQSSITGRVNGSERRDGVQQRQLQKRSNVSGPEEPTADDHWPRACRRLTRLQSSVPNHTHNTRLHRLRGHDAGKAPEVLATLDMCCL